MRAIRAAAFLLLAAFFWSGTASSAEIEILRDADVSLVAVLGEMKLGDEKTFINKVLDLDKAVVVFSSPGGSVRAAIRTGETIRLKGFVTLVMDGDTCASACALSWLAGRKLFAGPTAKIGFHAVYDTLSGKPEINGPGNALVGSYLTKLGLSDDAIIFMTSAAPASMGWLSFQDAAKVGIQVTEFTVPKKMAGTTPRPADRPADAPPPAPSRSTGGTVQQEPPNTASIEMPKSMLDGTWHPSPPALEAQLLDLATLDAAAQVQRRLQERGFFRNAVDGVWGPRSRIALREFKSRNGLGNDDSWTAAVQSALFDDRYRMAALDYVPPEPTLTDADQFSPFPGRSGAGLSPLNTGDALTIQRRLGALGYYRIAGDGTWGMASHAALRDFKAANGLPGDDRWDGPTEAALMNDASTPATATPFGEWAGIGTSCTDPKNPLRLTVSALEILAGGGVCRLEEALVHRGDDWVGTAQCSRGDVQVGAQVSLRLQNGRLSDRSIVQGARLSNVTFQRCR